MGDIAAVALGNAQRTFASLDIWPDRCPPADQLDIEAVRCRYYLRLQVADSPGVFANLAKILADHEISISSTLQHEPPADVESEGVPVVITTHHALEGSVSKALDEINRLDVVKAPCVCIRMVEEHPERVE